MKDQIDEALTIVKNAGWANTRDYNAALVVKRALYQEDGSLLIEIKTLFGSYGYTKLHQIIFKDKEVKSIRFGL